MADDGVDDFVGAAGVCEQLGEHCTERDQDADTRRGGAEAVGERIQHRLEVFARDDADRQTTENQGQEGVQLDDGDQDDDDRNAGQRGQDELPAGGDRFGRLGVGGQHG